MENGLGGFQQWHHIGEYPVPTSRSKSSRDVREWYRTQALMLCPSAVEGGSFIKTAMTCSQTGGMTVGEEGVIKVGMVSGGLAGGGRVEASGAVGEPEGVSGDTRPLGAVGIVWCGS